MAAPLPERHEEMPLFRWEDVDHSLVRLKLTDLAKALGDQINQDENQIRFDNRGNSNTNAIPSLVLKMKQHRVDEMAREVYEIYCDVWQTQGHAKSAAFVRAVYLHGIVPAIRSRFGGIASDFAGFATRTKFPVEIGNAHLRSLQLNILRLESRWHRRIEIEAKKLEHFERREMLAREEAQKQNVTRAAPSTGRPGRRPKLHRGFDECAGTLWRKATSEGLTVPLDRLRPIATELDAAGYLPPSAYLEHRYAQELKLFNSCNSNSKLGPIKTWSELISRNDKDILRGMRRLLSRCAGKLAGSRPLSAN